MNYLDVCSGISAPTAAWNPLGWQACAYAESDAFPSAVLKHHYPTVENVGDFTAIGGQDFAAELLVAGTPCQDFSVAGLRAGLDGARGQLTIEYARLAARLKPRWLLWENVPGVLSADGGRAFGLFLWLLGQCGYGFAYRNFDAKYAGVPQRRRRVFLVGHFGDHRRAAAVLFDHESMQGYPPPRREAGQSAAPTFSARTKGGGGLGTDFDCDGGLIAGTLQAAGKAAGSVTQQDAESGMLVAKAPALAINFRGRGGGTQIEIGGDVATALRCAGGSSSKSHALIQSAVRRLTPRECERLQGFSDDFTLVPYRGRMAADGPRYKALGNSMAVPDVKWIGERIAMVDKLEVLAS